MPLPGNSRRDAAAAIRYPSRARRITTPPVWKDHQNGNRVELMQASTGGAKNENSNEMAKNSAAKQETIRWSQGGQWHVRFVFL